MFRKEPEDRESLVDDSAPAALTDKAPQPAQEFTPRTVSYVGPTVFFKGEVSANEGLIIEGEIEGTIRHNGRNLTVGKQGRVRGEIHAKVVDVRGHVDGEIFGGEIVHLFSTSKVTGTIHCTRILMDDGAEFNGTIRMSGEAIQPTRKKLKIAENDGKIAKVAG